MKNNETEILKQSGSMEDTTINSMDNSQSIVATETLTSSTDSEPSLIQALPIQAFAKDLADTINSTDKPSKKYVAGKMAISVVVGALPLLLFWEGAKAAGTAAIISSLSANFIQNVWGGDETVDAFSAEFTSRYSEHENKPSALRRLAKWSVVVIGTMATSAPQGAATYNLAKGPLWQKIGKGSVVFVGNVPLYACSLLMFDRDHIGTIVKTLLLPASLLTNVLRPVDQYEQERKLAVHLLKKGFKKNLEKIKQIILNDKSKLANLNHVSADNALATLADLLPDFKAHEKSFATNALNYITSFAHSGAGMLVGLLATVGSVGYACSNKQALQDLIQQDEKLLWSESVGLQLVIAYLSLVSGYKVAQKFFNSVSQKENKLHFNVPLVWRVAGFYGLIIAIAAAGTAFDSGVTSQKLYTENCPSIHNNFDHRVDELIGWSTIFFNGCLGLFGGLAAAVGTARYFSADKEAQAYIQKCINLANSIGLVTRFKEDLLVADLKALYQSDHTKAAKLVSYTPEETGNLLKWAALAPAEKPRTWFFRRYLPAQERAPLLRSSPENAVSCVNEHPVENAKLRYFKA